MNNDAIVSYCKQFKPHLIYIAIGCSQRFHEPGSTMESPQGYPPFLRPLGTRQLCILIDPLLEDPPRSCFAQEPGQQLIQVGATHFIPVRRNFEWGSPEDSAFIHTLCKYTLDHARTRFIVQDYSGADIYPYYPIHIFGKELVNNVLFDFTYQNGGCFVDLSKVNILFQSDGFSFLQPLYERITYSMNYTTPAVAKFILSSRNNSFYSYVKRLHKIQEGVEEPRSWCTPEIVMNIIRPFCVIYNTEWNTNHATLELLMVGYLLDLCTRVGNLMTEEDAFRCVRSPDNTFQQTITLIKDVLIEENVIPQ